MLRCWLKHGYPASAEAVHSAHLVNTYVNKSPNSIVCVKLASSDSIQIEIAQGEPTAV